MKVAFVHDWLNGMRGGEKVLEALLDLWPDADIHTLFYEPEKISPKIRERRVHVSALQKLPLARTHYRHLLPLFPLAIRAFDLRRYDLVISVSHCVAKSACASSPARHFCYCLSPMRYLWSHFETYSKARETSGLARIGMQLLGNRLRAWDRTTSQRAGAYCAISQTIAERLQAAYKRSSQIIYPPVETDYFTPDSSRPGEYYLAVSSAVPYKRLDLAVEACNRLRQPLRVVGGGPGVEKLKALAGPTVEILGWVGDEQLRDLYRNCRALIFPPEEDFGIAPVEAQACGRPVLAFGKGGALETVIDGQTGAFFREQTVDALVQAIQTFEPEAYSAQAARTNALRFSTARFRREFASAIETFLEAGSNPVG